MSSTVRDNPTDAGSYKKPLAIPELIIGLLLSTYFLTVETIELSLSIYAVQQNNFEVYQQYLIFKNQAPIWKYWQLFTTLILPLTIFATVRDLIQILTKKATTQRHLLDVIAALQLFGILYVIIVRIMPLENQFMKTGSNYIAQDLNTIHWIAFALNIIGWFIPVFRYRESKNDMYSIQTKKQQ